VSQTGLSDIKLPEYLETKQPFGQIPVIEASLAALDPELSVDSRDSARYFYHRMMTFRSTVRATVSRMCHFKLKEASPSAATESRAICRFLVLKYGMNAAAPLIPPTSDLAATARFEIAASIETSNFDKHANPLWIEGYVNPKCVRSKLSVKMADTG